MSSKLPQLRLQSLSIILFIGLLTLVSAFAIVWMQQKISRTANYTAQLETCLETKINKLRYLDEKISKSHQPIVLQSRVAGFLRPAKDLQIHWVAEREGLQGRVYSDASASSITALGNLALLDTTTQPN